VGSNGVTANSRTRADRVSVHLIQLSACLRPRDDADIPSNLRSVQEVQKKLERLRQQNERLVPQKAEADEHLSKTTCRSLIL
jgi:hypothetical protein